MQTLVVAGQAAVVSHLRQGWPNPPRTLARLLLIPDSGMKSFLDRLRRKSAETRTRKTETVTTAPEPPAAEKVASAERPFAATVPEIPAAAKHLAPPPLPAPPDPKAPGSDYSIELNLGDFLERIPSTFLKPGQIDRSLTLRFDLNAIVGQFMRSDPRIPLKEIYKQKPEVFCREPLESDAASILLPWQKIIDLVVARDGGPCPLPREMIAALTQSLRKQRTAAEQAIAPNPPAAPAEPLSPARPPSDASARSWFSPKPMPAGALTTLPSTLRPPPTAGEALSLSLSGKKPAAAPSNGAVTNGRAPAAPAPSAPSRPEAPVAPEFEQAAMTKPAPPPPRPASEVLGEQLNAITGHFDRLVRQLEESAAAQAPVRAQHVPGLEHLVQAAEEKVTEANRERDALVSLKEHLDSQFEALTFAQNGIATLQETLEAQSREFGRVQQVLQNVEEQLAAMTGERDALAEENEELAGEISLLQAAASKPSDTEKRERELQDRITELETRLGEKRPIGPTLARRSAARAAAHRVGGPGAGSRALKSRLIHWPAYLNALNEVQQAPPETPHNSGKKGRRHKRR